MRNYRTDGTARAYGSDGVQPARNAAFTSPTGFARWKAKHPKKPYIFERTDIDNDGIADAVVWADQTRTEPVAVNGWGNKGSKARLYMQPDYDDGNGGRTDYWDAKARTHGAFRQEFFDAPITIKQTLKKFTKLVIKPIYDQIVPKTPENAQYRKSHPASRFTSRVAKILVGDALDADMSGRAGADNTPENRRKLHVLRIWKVEFDTRLGNWADNSASDPRSRDAVANVMGQVAQVLDAEDAGAIAPAGEIDLVARE
jgi:hypothetical protein